jgi:acyl-ACP thioesterase
MDSNVESGALYRNGYTIEYSDVDFTKELKLSTLFMYFQDTAGQAVERLGAGVDILAQKYSVTWVLLRIRVEIGTNPLINEAVTVETWPHPQGKLEFNRDYTVRDAKGNIIISGTSIWALMDTRTRELRRSNLIELKYPPFIQEHALDYKFGKLKPFRQPEVAYRKVIGYSDVDFNGHINNTRYIDYIMDCFPVESHKQYRVKAIEVNYLRETFPGDTLVMYKDISALDSNKVYIEGVNEEDGKPAFKAQIEIVPRENKIP